MPCQMWHNLSHVHCAPQAHPSRSLPLQPRHATALTLLARPEIPHQPIASQPLSSQPWPRLKPHRFAVRQAARFKTRMPWHCSRFRRASALGQWQRRTTGRVIAASAQRRRLSGRARWYLWSKTEAAVRAFQTAHGLQIDGIVGLRPAADCWTHGHPMPGSAATVVPSELGLTPDGQQPSAERSV